jgi:hypothetical protein
MRIVRILLGIVLLILGTGVLAYQGIAVTNPERQVRVSSDQTSVGLTRSVAPLPSLLSGVVLDASVVLVLVLPVSRWER